MRWLRKDPKRWRRRFVIFPELDHLTGEWVWLEWMWFKYELGWADWFTTDWQTAIPEDMKEKR